MLHFKVPLILLLLCAAIVTARNQTLHNNSSNLTASGVQVKDLIESLRGKRMAILTNPSCVDDQRRLVYDIVFENQQEYNYTLEYALAPEHGIRGDQDAGGTIYDYVDPETNITVYSLYGIRRSPTPEMLSRIDTMVYCILDVGTRFYTFIWTMSYAQEAVGNYNYNVTNLMYQPTIQRLMDKRNLFSLFSPINFIVLDRPNVLGGLAIEGCPLEVEAGYIGRTFNQNFTIPTRYAMTIGELALLFNYQYFEHPVQNIKIIKIPGYSRTQTFPNPALWVAPSPNMRTFDTAYVYPGTGIFEQTNVSEGRGTDQPFQIIGAPFIDGEKLASFLSNNPLFNETATFEPITFIPTTSKWTNSTCQGVKISGMKFDTYEPVLVGTTILQKLLTDYPDLVTLSKSGSNMMFGTKTFSDLIRNTTVSDILEGCSQNLEEFKRIRETYLIYPYY